MPIRKLLSVTAAVLASAWISYGQEFRGAILGRIMDPSGAVLAGAVVTATNQETNVKVEVKSNHEGNFNIPFLLPGVYTVRVEAGGFKAAVRPNVIVQINDRVALDFSLELGATREAVTVTAESPVLQTASADMGQVVERNMIDRFPLLSQNAMNLADMAPGVLGGSGNQMSNGQNEITINGGSGRERGNDITIDGIPNVAPRFNGLAVTVPAADAIQEFKVQTTMFDAQNGRSNGGVISFTTRGGTNQLHGSGYYIYYDEVLNANGWVRNKAGQPRAPINQYLAGGTIGGPVMLPKLPGLSSYNGRNRTFFFVNYEQQQNENDFTRYGRVPTALERKGDFSQTISLVNTPLMIYDPYTTQVVSGRTTRQPYPNNTIPLSVQDPTGQAVMNLYELPNQNVTPRIGSFNWLGQGRYKGSVKNLMTRFDQVISDRQRLYLRFSRVDGMDTRDPYAMKGVFDMPSSASGRTQDNINPRHNKSVALDDSYTLTPAIFASFRYGYTRTHLHEYFDGNIRDPRDQKLPPIVLSNQVSKGYAMFKVGENMPYFGSKVRTSVNDTHSLYVTFNHLKGRHTMKYGLDMRVVRWNENQPGESQNGEFYFDTRFSRSDPTTSSTINTSGTAMACLLQGLPYDARIGYNSALSLQSWYDALYFQDDIKVTRRLTLNLGLRYELEIPQTERYDRISFGVDPEYPLPLNIPGLPQLKGALLFVNQEGRSRRQALVDGNNFGPRFGYAYQIGGRTVLRGGYGLFFSNGLANISGSGSVNVNALGAQPSFNAVTRIPSSNSTDGGRTPITTMQNPFPNGLVTPTGNSLGPLTELGNSINYANPYRVLPYVQQWQFSIQHVVGWSTMVDAGYVGSHALKQFNTYNWNERNDAWLVQGSGEYDRIPNPFWGIFPVTSSLGGSAQTTRGRFWVKFPQFNNVNVYGMNTDRALYHSGQLAVRKRLSHGLMLNANYAYSKNMIYDGASLINVRKWRSVASTDRTHMMRLFATYALPVGRRKAFLNRAPKWLDAIAGGWEISSAFRITTGTPLSITERRGRPSPISNPVKTGPVSSRLGDQTDPKTGVPLNPYFDTAAWRALPDDYVISLEPLRYGWLRGPRTTALSAHGYKTFAIREGWKLEFRVEANNALNHPIFANPATDMNNPATFGTITSASGTRNVNLQAKIRF